MQWFVTADTEQHYFTIHEQHPELHDQLRAIAVLDLVANNTDRKSGHCLLGRPTTASVWGIDHGLCFAAEYKLRTVIWEFGGEPIPDALARAGVADCRERSRSRSPRCSTTTRSRRSRAEPRGASRNGSSPSTRPAAATPGRSSDGRRSGRCSGHDVSEHDHIGRRPRRADPRGDLDGLVRMIDDRCASRRLGRAAAAARPRTPRGRHRPAAVAGGDARRVPPRPARPRPSSWRRCSTRATAVRSLHDRSADRGRRPAPHVGRAVAGARSRAAGGVRRPRAGAARRGRRRRAPTSRRSSTCPLAPRSRGSRPTRSPPTPTSAPSSRCRTSPERRPIRLDRDRRRTMRSDSTTTSSSPSASSSSRGSPSSNGAARRGRASRATSARRDRRARRARRARIAALDPRGRAGVDGVGGASGGAHGRRRGAAAGGSAHGGCSPRSATSLDEWPVRAERTRRAGRPNWAGTAGTPTSRRWAGAAARGRRRGRRHRLGDHRPRRRRRACRKPDPKVVHRSRRDRRERHRCTTFARMRWSGSAAGLEGFEELRAAPCGRRRRCRGRRCRRSGLPCPC